MSHKKQTKKLLIFSLLTTGFLLLMNTPLLAETGKYPISDIIGPLYEKLELDYAVTAILKGIGLAIYHFLAFFADMFQMVFSLVAQFNPLSLPMFASVTDKLNIILPSIVVIGIVLLTLFRVLGGKDTHKILYNIVMVSIALSCFGTFITLLSNAKTDLISEGDTLVTELTSKTKVSETIFSENTYDVWANLNIDKTGYSVEPISITMKDNDLYQYADWEARLTKKQIGQRLLLDPENGKVVDNVPDGVAGFGDIRYFQYSSNFYAINLTLLVTIIFYAIACFTLAQMLMEFTINSFIGRFAIIKGLSEESSIANVFKEIGLQVAGIVVFYLLVSLYPSMATSIQNYQFTNFTDETAIIFAKILLTLGSGIAILMGNNVLQASMGTNFRNTGTMMGTLVVAGAGKQVKKGASKGKAIAGAEAKKGVTKTKEYFNDNKPSAVVANANDDFSNTFKNDDTVNDILASPPNVPHFTKNTKNKSGNFTRTNTPPKRGTPEYHDMTKTEKEQYDNIQRPAWENELTEKQKPILDKAYREKITNTENANTDAKLDGTWFQDITNSGWKEKHGLHTSDNTPDITSVKNTNPSLSTTTNTPEIAKKPKRPMVDLKTDRIGTSPTIEKNMKTKQVKKGER